MLDEADSCDSFSCFCDTAPLILVRFSGFCQGPCHFLPQNCHSSQSSILSVMVLLFKIEI